MGWRLGWEEGQEFGVGSRELEAGSWEEAGGWEAGRLGGWEVGGGQGLEVLAGQAGLAKR